MVVCFELLLQGRAREQFDQGERDVVQWQEQEERGQGQQAVSGGQAQQAPRVSIEVVPRALANSHFLGEWD